MFVHNLEAKLKKPISVSLLKDLLIQPQTFVFCFSLLGGSVKWGSELCLSILSIHSAQSSWAIFLCSIKSAAWLTLSMRCLWSASDVAPFVWYKAASLKALFSRVLMLHLSPSSKKVVPSHHMLAALPVQCPAFPTDNRTWTLCWQRHFQDDAGFLLCEFPTLKEAGCHQICHGLQTSE